MRRQWTWQCIIVVPIKQSTMHIPTTSDIILIDQLFTIIKMEHLLSCYMSSVYCCDALVLKVTQKVAGRVDTSWSFGTQQELHSLHLDSTKNQPALQWHLQVRQRQHWKLLLWGTNHWSVVVGIVFILDLKGKVLISRNYRGDIPMSAVEKFMPLVSELWHLENTPE